MNRRTLLLLVVGVIAMSWPKPAYAWSRDGHRMVCRIAWQLLQAPQRAAIERLTSAYRDPEGNPVASFFDACAWADDVRANANRSESWKPLAVFETWHYANVPRTTTRFPNPPCQVPCVITAVTAHLDSLTTTSNERSKSQALFFLSHWVGDLHQPLHVSYEDDRGGNSVRPIEGGFYSTNNLHATWDSGIAGKMFGPGEWQSLADRLAQEITPSQRAAWEVGTPTDWAQESYDIVTSQPFQYCEWQEIGGARTCAARPGGRELGEEYQEHFAPVVRQRLQQAGVRLARLLAASLPRNP